jgi:hypothetical protein
VFTGPAVATVLNSCSFAALKTAVAAGGTVDYGVDCQSPPVSFTSTITVPAGLSVDIEANGHSVTFDGGAKVRLLEVTGGRLTVGGISLDNAQAATASGTAGSNGAAGVTGAPGAAGANGTNGSSPGASGGPGQPGGAGGAATAGHASGAGKNAKLARGAALLITSGTVTLTSDTFSNDIASGGAGGPGGAGGNGGSGGTGGDGGIGGGGAGGAPSATGGAGGPGGPGGTGRRGRPAELAARAEPAGRRRAGRCGTPGR